MGTQVSHGDLCTLHVLMIQSSVITVCTIKFWNLVFDDSLLNVARLAKFLARLSESFAMTAESICGENTAALFGTFYSGRMNCAYDTAITASPAAEFLLFPEQRIQLIQFARQPLHFHCHGRPS